MHSLAVILAAPQRIELRPLPLAPIAETDVLVEIAWSGISTGTEKLLWSGAMPPFPGMGYPLVPGYESVGQIVEAGARVRARVGEWVFVPGANCFEGAHALFGGSAERVVLPSPRALRIGTCSCSAAMRSRMRQAASTVPLGIFPARDARKRWECAPRALSRADATRSRGSTRRTRTTATRGSTRCSTTRCWVGPHTSSSE